MLAKIEVSRLFASLYVTWLGCYFVSSQMVPGTAPSSPNQILHDCQEEAGISKINRTYSSLYGETLNRWCSIYNETIDCIDRKLEKEALASDGNWFLSLIYDSHKARVSSMDVCNSFTDFAENMTCLSSSMDLITFCINKEINQFRKNVPPLSTTIFRLYSFKLYDNEYANITACLVATYTANCFNQYMFSCPKEVKRIITEYYMMLNGKCDLIMNPFGQSDNSSNSTTKAKTKVTSEKINGQPPKSTKEIPLEAIKENAKTNPVKTTKPAAKENGENKIATTSSPATKQTKSVVENETISTGSAKTKTPPSKDIPSNDSKSMIVAAESFSTKDTNTKENSVAAKTDKPAQEEKSGKNPTKDTKKSPEIKTKNDAVLTVLSFEKKELMNKNQSDSVYTPEPITEVVNISSNTSDLTNQTEQVSQAEANSTISEASNSTIDTPVNTNSTPTTSAPATSTPTTAQQKIVKSKNPVDIFEAILDHPLFRKLEKKGKWKSIKNKINEAKKSKSENQITFAKKLLRFLKRRATKGRQPKP